VVERGPGGDARGDGESHSQLPGGGAARSVVFVDVDVVSPAGERVAKGLVTYKLGYGGK
jgi:hypothetical protein